MAKKAPKEVKYISVTRLLCNFATYLKERTKCFLPVSMKCQKCGRDFEEKDIIYVAKLENGLKHVICEDCGKE